MRTKVFSEEDYQELQSIAKKYNIDDLDNRIKHLENVFIQFGLDVGNKEDVKYAKDLLIHSMELFYIDDVDKINWSDVIK